MPTVTFDHRGLTINGTRRWIVSGTIDPSQIPADLWSQRLRAAAEAGLNTILVPAVWSQHEPRPGAFDFTENRDLAAFIKLAATHNLMVALRPGPFQGAGYDRGGIPPWVTSGTDDTARPNPLRSPYPEFLQACAAWFSALGSNLKSLQATNGGPIVLVQNEHRYFCSDPDSTYLNELARYLREAGFTVPHINSNNLYAAAEGEIDAWNGHANLTQTLRQLRAVRPNQPTFLWDFELARPATWGTAPTAPNPARALHDLAQAIATGAQPNLGPFAGTSRLAFTGGRLPFARDAYTTQSADTGAPLDEAGRPTPLLDAIKPILQFTSSFDRLLTTIHWHDADACLLPQPSADTIIHAKSDTGSVVFLLRDPDSKNKKHTRAILLPDGRQLTVDLSDSPAVWCLLGVSLGPASKLDYATTSAIWSGPRALALTAPAGSSIELSINGSSLVVTPTKGRTPQVIEHEGVTVTALSTEQAAAAIITPDGLLIGAAAQGTPREGWKKWTLLKPDGTTDHGTWAAPVKPSRRTLSSWTRTTCDPFTTGTSERFAVLDAPATLDALGTPTGYAWLRLRFKAPRNRKPKALAPESGDRVHLYTNGALVEVAGLAPGATEAPFTLPIAKGEQSIVGLLDNLGRPSGGWSELQSKGMWGPIYEVKPFAAGAPSMQSDAPVRPLSFRSPLTRLHADDETAAARVTWSFTHRRKSPILFRAGALPDDISGVLLVNNEFVEMLDSGSRGDIVLRQGEHLKASTNTVQFAPLGDPDTALEALRASATFFECVDEIGTKGEWAAARWEMPKDNEYTEAEKTMPAGPAWWRGTFPAQRTSAPLVFDPRGLTKGQLYLNGHNIGRYFAATCDGKAIAGQRGLYLPEPWVHADKPNTITIFDEHGAAPDACKVREFQQLRG